MFPPLLVLIGACLAVLGSRWPVAHMPFMGETTLSEVSMEGTWIVRVAVAVVVAAVALRWRWPAWLAWILAVGALLYTANDLWMQIGNLKKQIAEAGDPDLVRSLQKTIEDTRFRPGAFILAGGLLLQLLALVLKPKPRLPRPR